jgi:hypothetical protein
MSDTLKNPEDIAKNLPPEIKEAAERFGFHALVARVYGVDEVNEKTAAQIIGTKLAQRLRDRREIAVGLNALRELSK